MTLNLLALVRKEAAAALRKVREHERKQQRLNRGSEIPVVKMPRDRQRWPQPK